MNTTLFVGICFQLRTQNAMNLVLPSCSFPPIEYIGLASKAEHIVICKGEYFVKQTFRNRYAIATSNGLLRLTIPVSGSKNHKPMHEMEICYKENWPVTHWKSLISAYRNSPYFEYFEADLRKLIFEKESQIGEFNTKSVNFLLASFKAKPEIFETNDYVVKYDGFEDLRNYHFSGQRTNELKSYLQPFGEKNGFIANLSSLDLLFCQGPKGLSYITV